jgi:tRNA threonylcarbamoyladenosine biosynthesis protein TsaB
MSHLLAIDLSTPHGQLAVVDASGSCLFEAEFSSNRSHNSMLYGPLTEAMAVIGRDLARIIIGTGPGSYTGVRIAIAAAQGLAISRQAQVVAHPSITALDSAANYWAIGDARRGKFYIAAIINGQLREAPQLHDAEAVQDILSTQPDWPLFTTDAQPPLGLSQVQLRRPNAKLLAQHAPAIATECPEPLYMQEAFVTQAKTKIATPNKPI